MEQFNADALRRFVSFMIENDPQILANRREGRTLYVLARRSDGDFEYSADKADKLETFLTLNDTQVHAAGQEGAVSIFAFVKILGDLRRRLRATPGTSSGTATPTVPPPAWSGPVGPGSFDYGAAGLAGTTPEPKKS